MQPLDVKKMNFRTILSSMQPKKNDRGKNFIEILSFRLSLEHLGYGVLLDVKKRVNVFYKNFLDRKEEATKLLCLSKRMILHATLIPTSSCTCCFSTQKTSRAY
jgi:hypothetical protein